MGLSGRENEEIYLSLLQKVRKAAPRSGIDMTKTIHQIRPIIVIRFIALCQKKWPFFRRFEDGWPLRDMLASYLVNQKASANRKNKQLKAAGINTRDLESASESEKAGSEEEGDNNSEDEEGPQPKKIKKDTKVTISSAKIKAKRSPSGCPKKPQTVESDGDLSDSDDELANVPPAKARKVNKAHDVKLEDIFSDGEIALAPRKSKLKPAPDHDEDTDPEESQSDESKSNQKPKKGHAPDETPFKWTEADIPLVCPEEDCNDAVTRNPSVGLVALFRDRAWTIHEQGANANGVWRLNLKICTTMRVTRDIDDRYQRAQQRGLFNVDFQLLANHVWDLKDVIDPLMIGPDARSDTFVWTNLLDNIKSISADSEDEKYSLEELNTGANIPQPITDAARPGRYGQRGAAVIKNTLMSMYSNLAPVMIPASSPLTLRAYTDFFLIPHIAALLIGQDTNTDIEGGWETMQSEGNHRDDENPLMDDDEILDAVFAANARQSQITKSTADKKKQNVAKSTTDKKGTKRPRVTAVPDVKANKENNKPLTIRIGAQGTRSHSNKLTMEDYPPPTRGTDSKWKVAQPAK
ncbi:hypothetical protein PILCRDRAFT_17367 [Piloderma croceum F 1598]|uniref:Restriction of telomere capping protein 4 C-terminal domain-containing protein n=1 Tax=Piloderma croceum (strain F 1598) TaxID=765440 RepID=A0A0C3ABH1_PILCF|nr:hypothetical protein PILCRDRAFT_17367 [Piloderma croceum F 1598]